MTFAAFTSRSWRAQQAAHTHSRTFSGIVAVMTQTVIIEDLPVRNMVRNHTLARAISDAAWAQLRRQLEYKADWYGRTVIAVDRFYPTSKTCSVCGVVPASTPGTARRAPGCIRTALTRTCGSVGRPARGSGRSGSCTPASPPERSCQKTIMTLFQSCGAAPG